MATKSKPQNKVTLFAIGGLFLLVLLLIVFAVVVLIRYPQSGKILSFEDCVAAGNPVIDTLPEKCETKEGKIFTKIISGEQISVNGQIICLPHRDTNGPQTLECAIGITEGGLNYGLINLDFNDPEIMQTGRFMYVTGTIEKPPAGNIYDIQGVIEVKTIVPSGYD